MRAVLVRGSRGVGMDVTIDPQFPAPLGHMNMDFFAKAFRRLGWEVDIVGGWLSGVTESNLAEVVSRIDPDVAIWPEGSHALVSAPSSCLVINYVNDAHTWNPGNPQRFVRTDAFLSRHLSGVDRMRKSPATSGKPVYYFPFSVDLELVPILKWGSRLDRVGFTGSADEYLYPNRVRAATALSTNGLLDDSRARWLQVPQEQWLARGNRLSQIAINHHDVAGGKSVEYKHYAQTDPKDYFEYLTRFKIVLTCSSSWRLLLNKDYEVPASGAVLLTDGGARGLNEVLPTGSYLTYRDPEDAVRVVRRALADPAGLKAQARMARDHVREHHSDSARVELLSKILEDLMRRSHDDAV